MMKRLRAHALERDDRQQLVGARSGRRRRRLAPSARGIQNSRNSPITWSMRRPPACAQHRADGLDERPVARRAQAPRDERRQPPVLAAGVELVGRARRPTRRAAMQSCQHQASAPATSRPIGRSWTTRSRATRAPAARRSATASRRGSGCARVARPRKRATAAPSGRRSRRASCASPCRAARPARSRWRSRSSASPCRRGTQSKPCSPREAGEERLQRLHLEAEDRVAIDARLGVERAARVGQAVARVRRQSPQPGSSSMRRYSGLRIAPARRVIRARLDRGDRRRRGQRVDHQHAARRGCASSAPRRARSARSPMPQLARERAAYSWAANPQVRRSSGR